MRYILVYALWGDGCKPYSWIMLLCTPWRNVPSLTSVLNWIKWSASCFGRFTPLERILGSSSTWRWVAPPPVCTLWGRGMSSLLPWNEPRFLERSVGTVFTTSTELSRFRVNEFLPNTYIFLYPIVLHAYSGSDALFRCVASLSKCCVRQCDHDEPFHSAAIVHFL
jgi:hypothetical protein